MPAARAQGMAPNITWTATITTEAGEQVGIIEESTISFNVAPDGWLETTALPVPIIHEAPNQAEPIEDLYGVPATVRLSVTDGEGEAELELNVTLSEG
jgi:hypothetical protein